MVDLEGFETRKVATLSGGQQQRIAIARALVNEPQILLLDEPLGALDLKMRKEMQLELKSMHERLGITFIYVTHDQEEALTMSDKIVVMSEGRMQQIGTPEDIYNEPKNAFVADFIGESNIFTGIMTDKLKVRFCGAEFACVDDVEHGRLVEVVVRPEDVEITTPENGAITGTVTSVVFKGVHYEITVESGKNEIVIQSTKTAAVGSQVGLNAHAFLRPDKQFPSVDMRRKGDALLPDTAQTGQRKHLKAAAVGQNRPVPSGEPMQPAHIAYQIITRTNVQMIRIAQLHLAFQLLQVISRYGPLYRSTGGYIHKGRRLYSSVRRSKLPTARAPLLQHYLHRNFLSVAEIRFVCPVVRTVLGKEDNLFIIAYFLLYDNPDHPKYARKAAVLCPLPDIAELRLRYITHQTIFPEAQHHRLSSKTSCRCASPTSLRLSYPDLNHSAAFCTP